jgi:hypothetical protein
MFTRKPGLSKVGDSWSDDQVRLAGGVLLNTPNVSKSEFSRQRTIEVLKLGAWLVVTAGLAFIHPALYVAAWFVGLLLVDPGYFARYSRTREKIQWAERVIEESNTSPDDPGFGPVLRATGNEKPPIN